VEAVVGEGPGEKKKGDKTNTTRRGKRESATRGRDVADVRRTKQGTDHSSKTEKNEGGLPQRDVDVH